MPNRCSAEPVSTVPSAGTSTLNNECCGLKGILGCVVCEKQERKVEEDAFESRGKPPFSASFGN